MPATPISPGPRLVLNGRRNPESSRIIKPTRRNPESGLFIWIGHKPTMATFSPIREVVKGDVDYDGRVIIYIIKADQTNWINFIKPLILAEELDIPYLLSIIDTKNEEYRRVHPERYVPALKDQDPEDHKEITVFESTACLQYLSDRFDQDGAWAGRSAWEKAQVVSWTAYQTAGLGATAKYWLYFMKGYPNRQNPESLPKVTAKLHQNTLIQWDILDKRLSLPRQSYIALPDRPTIADISYFPYAMPWMFKFFNVDIKDWPNVQAWSERMLARPAVQRIVERGPKYGHDLE
ncbi:glutathione S-transferase [Annulohypoxylon maeteangense]|uniref:glutathione S-transferase n=1 Tax=Annulohypoxylon maeteangense TaxID=1927788 RepID=UPI002007758B|nr:glutathione S-transferase [Annulohypoxylon maeteangense]KAI0886480.1 glutathione S-transferase [Annulohypoxylon maeteangense]